MVFTDKKFSLQPIKAKASFYMISDKLNRCIGVVNCSLHTRSSSPKHDYHKKSKDVFAYTLKK